MFPGNGPINTVKHGIAQNILRKTQIMNFLAF